MQSRSKLYLVLIAVTLVLLAFTSVWSDPKSADLEAPARQGAGDSATAADDKQAETVEAPAKQEAEPRYYTVRKGDALSRIARRFGVTVRALAQANRIRNPDRIKAGQRLTIPTAGAGANQDGAAGRDRDSLVDTALSYRGVPYRYAGMTSRGMDCSGLVARVLRAHGIRAPHNSRELFKLGKRVTRKEMQPGDLVFFRTRGRTISHVGIYMGDGKFVHASSGGGQVQVDTLDTGYYARRLAGARRLP